MAAVAVRYPKGADARTERYGGRDGHSPRPAHVPRLDPLLERTASRPPRSVDWAGDG